MEIYHTIYKGGNGEIVEKKSRFIAEVHPVTSEEEAMEILEQTRKQYWDARHHCWAYIIGRNPAAERMSDDGEPAGTAGKPILEVIRGRELTNVPVSYTHLRAHETDSYLVCRLLLEKKKKNTNSKVT